MTTQATKDIRERNQRVIARTMSEAELQANVINAARQLGWLVMHIRPARTKDGEWRTPYEGDKGYPDLTLARRGRRIFAELKREGKKPEPEQELWLEALGDAYVWRPSDWLSGDIERLLA